MALIAANPFRAQGTSQQRDEALLGGVRWRFQIFGEYR